MIVAELQQKVNLKASSNMVLIPRHWSFRREYSQDKSGMGKHAWKPTDFINRAGTVKIRRSSPENRRTKKRVRLKLRTHDYIYPDGKVAWPSKERREERRKEGGQQNGGAREHREHGRMSEIVIKLARIETKWC
ncbi:uncharacterized protein TNCV_4728521 [Trichonephila clavipes]|nr:uncharacterized protein TNCV_4728521 [Trichonephila clavipes]